MSELGDTALRLFDPIEEPLQPPMEDFDGYLSGTKAAQGVEETVDTVREQLPQQIPAGQYGYLTNVEGIPDGTPAVQYVDASGKKYYKYVDQNGHLVDRPVESAEDTNASFKLSYEGGGVYLNMGTLEGQKPLESHRRLQANALMGIAQSLDPSMTPVHTITSVQQQANAGVTAGVALDGREPIALGAGGHDTAKDFANQADTGEYTTDEARTSMARRTAERIRDMDPETKGRIGRIAYKSAKYWLLFGIIFYGGHTVIDDTLHAPQEVAHKVSFGLIPGPTSSDPYKLTTDYGKDALKLISGPIGIAVWK